MNIAMLAELAAQGGADRVAVGDTLGYTELWEWARHAAGWLSRCDAENVAFLGVGSPAFPVALFGAAVADLPFCPLNYRWTADQLRSALRRLAPAVLIADAGLAPEPVDGVTVIDRERFLAEIEAAEPGPETAPEPRHPAVLLFTSGTSGEPKVALLGHQNLCAYILGTVEFMAAEPGDTQLVSVPPYHVGGVANLLSAVYNGRRVVQLPAFDPNTWVETVTEQRITHAMVVPTMLSRILPVLAETGAPLESLRHLSYGGGRMPLPVVEETMRRLPHVGLVNGYGLTETSSTVTVLGPEDHRAAVASDDPNVRRRLGSVGRPLPSVEVSVRDAEGNPLPPEEVGELWVRGDQISGEYAGSGSSRDSEEWFHTKDSGFLDEGGYVFVHGRLDDVIVRGGENMSPGEIEDVLLAHPAVADAGVIGLPDDEWGEKVVAAVVAQAGAAPDPERLRGWVRERLRSAKTPSVIAVVDALPYNDNGKLLRRQLRAELSGK